MCGEHRHSCHTDGQRQEKTPEGTLHTYKPSDLIRIIHLLTPSCSLIPYLICRKKTSFDLHATLSLAYDFHEDLFPVLACLETSLQSRGLWEAGKLLLDEVFPLKEVRIGLEGGFPLVCSLGSGEDEH